MDVPSEILDYLNYSEQSPELFKREYDAYLEVLSMLDKARRDFLADGTEDACVRPAVLRSWKRCRSSCLHDYIGGLRAVGGKALAECRSKSAFLLTAASPVLRDIFQQITNTSCLCFVFLTDAHGVVLDFKCSRRLMPLMENMGMREGAVWSEDCVGTNAVSLALELGENYHTYAPEHYYEEHQLVNCFTALIHNNDGEIVGTLTVTFYREYFNDFMVSVVETAAKLIEKQLMAFRYTASMNYIINDTSEGVIILNSHLVPIQINKAFRRMIDLADETAKPDVRMLFKEFDFDAFISGGGLHEEMGETFLSYKNIYARVSMDIYRIDAYGTADGYVLTCRAIEDIISLSRQFTALGSMFRFEDIITENPRMLSLIADCRQIAVKNCPILLEGESGTGKEVFAQSIHSASERKHGPFVAVNCAALPVSLVESELFGYEKGSFTDGLATGKAGKFELADGGTIFLDEIGELPLDVQAKLLRVLDNHRITRIGGKAEKALDIRVIAATNRDLYRQVRQRSFREDLYYRINVVNFVIPPLSKRTGDISLLAEHFLSRLNIDNRGISKSMSAPFREKLLSHEWTGNVRELQNIVTRAYYLSTGTELTVSQLPPEFDGAEPIESPSMSGDTIEDMEFALMRRALEDCGGNVSRASEKIHMSRATFYRKLKAYGIGG